jgi:NCAIR mutase (PurE)-related protein
LNLDALRVLLENVQSGTLSPDDALHNLRDLPFEELEFAKVDHHRALRQGFPEVIFSQGKTPAQVAAIAQSLGRAGSPLLATRADFATYERVKEAVPHAVYHEAARIISATGEYSPHLEGNVGVLCAGTSDLPVFEEAAVTLEAMGASVRRITDVGVAGLHRLLAFREELQRCDVLIVVAGMEGALPSVVGGLVAIPVIAVPTSVGYGASFGGLAALLGMLNTCASGVAVVNIDNGFGAAAFAASILRAKNRNNAPDEYLPASDTL